MSRAPLAGRPRRVLYNELNEDGTIGGSHQCLLDLLRRLDRSRFAPVVVFYQDNPCVERLRALGAEVRVWEEERLRERVGSGPWRRARLVAAVAAAIARRAAFLRRERIDLLHLNNSPIATCEDWLPAARVARLPVITHCRAEVLEGDGRLRRWLAGRFDRVVAISRTVADSLRRAGVPEKRIRLVYDGIDVEALRERASGDPVSIRRALAVRDGEFLVVMVGHLRAWKGQHVLLEALCRLDPGLLARTRAVVVGDVDHLHPSYSASLREAADEPPLRDRVSFLGPRDDAPALMSAADVLVHASTVPEPLGLVVLEGMALGKPVVASRLGGPSETMTPGSGLLFDPAHPEELARHLEALAADPALRRSLGEGGARRVGSFGIEANVRAVESLYEELL